MCDGSGARTLRAVGGTGHDDEDLEQGWWATLRDVVRESVSALSAFEIDCATCGGSGEVESTRARTLRELTSAQLSFLFRADLERDPMADTDGAGIRGRPPQSSQMDQLTDPNARTYEPGNFPRP